MWVLRGLVVLVCLTSLVRFIDVLLPICRLLRRVRLSFVINVRRIRRCSCVTRLLSCVIRVPICGRTSVLIAVTNRCMMAPLE